MTFLVNFALLPHVLSSIVVLNAWRTSGWLEHFFNVLISTHSDELRTFHLSTCAMPPPPYKTESVKAKDLETNDLIIAWVPKRRRFHRVCS